jgi:hypothetical protein
MTSYEMFGAYVSHVQHNVAIRCQTRAANNRIRTVVMNISLFSASN